MTDYRLCYRDGHGRITGVLEIARPDDARAIKLADGPPAGAPAKLWQLARRVQPFEAEGWK